MSAPDQELKKELDATLQARKELGPEYESELIDSFLATMEKRLDGQVERRIRRELTQARTSAARVGAPARRPRGRDDGTRNRRFGLASVSLVFAIPLSAIAAVNAHLPGLLATWAGIVGVNIAHSMGAIFHERGDRRDRDMEREW
ncbi:hypothetical protein NGB36_07755 [Streptomyces sp. RB6PN25]|uniref:Integral membrane protein n=1 Tax=Streptomyces humicola TaxID=2953240 RepID=A0ABT1PTP5_9ACTN|nr:hypothetical protein [Streptomyces humicola]MCQ4080498.1 hypothetical protein [Streptomyces humicola]